MKFLSLSLETTGLDCNKNNLLEIGMIVHNTDEPKSYEDSKKTRFWIDSEFYKGAPYALVDNVEIFKQICDLRKENSRRLVKPDDAITRIMTFLRIHFAENGVFNQQIMVVSKNPILDSDFLSKLKSFENLPFQPKYLNPCSFFLNFEEDNGIPGLAKAKERAGLTNPTVRNTLLVAWDMIELIKVYRSGVMVS